MTVTDKTRKSGLPYTIVEKLDEVLAYIDRKDCAGARNAVTTLKVALELGIMQAKRNDRK